MPVGAGKSLTDSDTLLETGRRVMREEANAVSNLANRLGKAFLQAIELLLECRGRVIVSGIGKSGHIARKIAATLASTGTPAFFVHPAEASHGDLGMITEDDVVLAISNSGETPELLSVVPFLTRRGTRVISISGNENSTLSKQADLHLDARVDSEACPLGLAPTTSTTAALALGDALAVTLLQARGFTKEDFARSHPGGTLGKRLLLRVSDLMHKGNRVPKVAASSLLSEAILEMSRKGLGMTAIVDANDAVVGIFTDGDLRRALEVRGDLRGLSIDLLMKRDPLTIHADKLAVEAVDLMQDKKISGLLVLDERRILVGALHMHDLLRAGIL